MIEHVEDAVIERFRTHRARGPHPEERRLVIVRQSLVKLCLGVGQQHFHRFDQAQPDDPADGGTVRRDEADAGEGFLDRSANIVLAVDQRAVAIEQRKASGRAWGCHTMLPSPAKAGAQSR